MATGISSPLALSGLYPSVDGSYVAANGKPFTSVSNAESALNGFPSKLSESCVGLTVLVKESGWTEAKEYWVQPKGTTPETYGLVEKGTTDYNDLDNKPTIGDGTNTALPIVGNVKVTASTALGETAGVTVTPGQTTGEIEMNFTLPKGNDAYEVYLEKYKAEHSGSTDGAMSKTEWLASLKGADGADGQDGADGADAVNPFKGYYPTGVSKPATGAVGDYLYAPPSDQTSSATATIWHYDANQTSPWTDTAINVSNVVGVEFGSGQSVPATKIKDENGEEVTGPASVLSAEAGVKLNKKLNPTELSNPTYVAKMGFDENYTFNSNYNLTTSYLHLKAGESFKVVLKETIASSRWRFGVTVEPPAVSVTATNGGMKDNPAVGDTIFEYTAEEECYVCVSTSTAYNGKYEFYITKDTIKDIQDSIIKVNGDITTIEDTVEDLNKKTRISTLSSPSSVSNMAFNDESNGFITTYSSRTDYLHLNAGESCKVVKTVEALGRWRFGVTTEIPSLNTTVTNGGMKDNPAIGSTIFEYTATSECYICVSASIIYINECEFYITKSISDSIEDIQDSIEDIQDSVTTKEQEIQNRFTNILFANKTNPTKCLTLLHFSDIHGNTANLRRIVAFKNSWSENIDDVICTGDLVSDTFPNTFIFDDSVVEGSEDILLCIGNHDTAYREGADPMDWYHYAGTQDAYNRYMANVSQWGVTQPTGAGADSYYPCYYYKDYIDKNVRLIVLDMMTWGNDIANGVSDENNVQSIWLDSVLTSAKTAGLHVVIAEHFPHFAKTVGVSYPKTADVIDSDFSLPNRYPQYTSGYDAQTGGVALGVISAKIESFITAGGHFVCWICGHTHFDLIEKVIGTEQKVVVIGTASAANDTQTIRNSADDSMDLFNIFSVDTTNRIVKVFRIGGHLSPALQKIDTMHFTY